MSKKSSESEQPPKFGIKERIEYLKKISVPALTETETDADKMKQIINTDNTPWKG
jgi:hypothetical protein